MDAIKLATPEQVEAIKDKSDLTPRSRILAMGNDIAVIRDTVEVDPVFFAENSNYKRKAMFFWGIENMLRAMGYTELYFNVQADNETFISVLKNLGAEPVSEAPEIRFKKKLD